MSWAFDSRAGRGVVVEPLSERCQVRILTSKGTKLLSSQDCTCTYHSVSVCFEHIVHLATPAFLATSANRRDAMNSESQKGELFGMSVWATRRITDESVPLNSKGWCKFLFTDSLTLAIDV
jgi:hypothetical protein